MEIGLLAIGIASLISFIFLITVRFLNIESEILDKEWDMKTATSSDYCVEITFEMEHWTRWLQEKKNYSSFRVALREQIIEQLSKIEAVTSKA
jgi:hypothetical protein